MATETFNSDGPKKLHENLPNITQSVLPRAWKSSRISTLKYIVCLPDRLKNSVENTVDEFQALEI